MKVKLPNSGCKPMELEEALEWEMEASTNHGCGQIEQLQADMSLMKSMLAKFMAARINSVEELNSITQWRTYEVVK